MQGFEIVQAIWQHSEGPFVFVPQKIYEKWVEVPAYSMRDNPPQQPDEKGRDSYFSVLRFDRPSRQAHNVGSPGVLYADLDAVHPESLRIRPSVAWETSPGSFQAVWFLDTTVQIDVQQSANRAWAQEIGADHGSWISTKVLRVPGTLNWKRRNEETGMVPYGRLLFFEDRTYPLKQFPVSNISSVTISSPLTPEECAVIRSSNRGLPLRIRSWLQQTRVPDRSMHIRKLARAFKEEGYHSSVAFAYMVDKPFNKFAQRPDELMKQIESV